MSAEERDGREVLTTSPGDKSEDLSARKTEIVRRRPVCKCFSSERKATNMAGSKGGSGGKTFQVGRNANTGKLTTVATARARPSTHVVERMPKPGHGDTKK